MICGMEFETPYAAKNCPACIALEAQRRQERREAREKAKKKPPYKPQYLVDMEREARAAGMSYGRYSAMMRGLLKV